MSDILLSVDEAARQLRLHPKTVLRHIREGRLRATRIGKAYRIERASLDAFAGVAAGARASDGGARATCVLDVPTVTADGAQRIATFLTSAAMTGDGRTPSLHIATAFDPRAGSLKIVLVGALADTARLIEMVQLLLAPRP